MKVFIKNLSDKSAYKKRVGEISFSPTLLMFVSYFNLTRTTEREALLAYSD